MPRKTIAQLEAEHAQELKAKDAAIGVLERRLEAAKEALNETEKQARKFQRDLNREEAAGSILRARVEYLERVYATLRGAFLVIDGGGPERLAKVESDQSHEFTHEEVPF